MEDLESKYLQSLRICLFGPFKFGSDVLWFSGELCAELLAVSAGFLATSLW